MYRIFQGKNASSLKRKAVVNIKTITVDVNVVDINVTTRRKITKRPSVLWERTMEEQKYYILGEGEEIKEDCCKDHLVVPKGIDY